MESKTEATMWKSMKSWVRNRCRKWPCILFGVTFQENKQCYLLVQLKSQKWNLSKSQVCRSANIFIHKASNIHWLWVLCSILMSFLSMPQAHRPVTPACWLLLVFKYQIGTFKLRFSDNERCQLLVRFWILEKNKQQVMMDISNTVEEYRISYFTPLLNTSGLNQNHNFTT